MVKTIHFVITQRFELPVADTNSKRSHGLWNTNRGWNGISIKFKVCSSRFSSKKLHVSLM